MTTGWSTTARWSGVTRGDFIGLLRHDARDVDRQNGREVSHSNTFIDPQHTARNVTLVNDGTGKLVPMTRVEEAIDFLEKKIDSARNVRQVKDKKTGEIREVPVAVRRDANVAVEFILKLDPRYTRDPQLSDEAYDALTREQRAALPVDVAHLSEAQVADVRTKLHAMAEVVIERMGAENVVFLTEHWDESVPHIQMAVVPMTPDGKLSQKQVLGGTDKSAAQANYVEIHDRMRRRLRDIGYNATFDRVSAGKKNQSQAEYKASQDRIRQEKTALRELDQRENELRAREADIDEEMAKLPAIRRKSREEGFREGKAQGEAEGLVAAQEAAAKLEAQARAKLEATARLLAQTTNEGLPPAMDAFLDERDGAGRRAWVAFSSKLRENPALRKEKLSAAKAAKNERINATKTRMQRLAATLPQEPPRAPEREK